MTFTTIKLAGDRVLVQGQDQFGVEGKQVLDSSQWADINAHKQLHSAEQSFDDAVEAFFKPLTDAAEALGKANARSAVDSDSIVVLHEEVEGVQGKSAQVVHLSHDSTVLRLLESGKHNRLVWVNDVLEILEATPSVPVAPESNEPTSSYLEG